MSTYNDEWSEIRAIITECYAEVETSGDNRVNVKRNIYERLRARGLEKAAEVFMFYDAFVRANMPTGPVLNISNSQIANANFGNQIGTITSSLQVVSSRDSDGAEFADALRQLTEGVVNSKELNDQQKGELLQGLSYLGKQAEESPEKRHSGILKPVLRSIPDMLSVAASLTELWHSVGPQILRFFGL